MTIIGALCYGSLFLYREELLLHIKAHPLRIALNKDKDKCDETLDLQVATL